MSGRSSMLLDGYQLRLPAFEGPLDLLLTLIERNQLDVTEVSLVAVTEQFMVYIAGLTSAPAEVLADFMTTAARLLLLKTRSLLPRPVLVDDDEEETDDLVDRLREYQLVKLAAEELRGRESRGAQSWPRLAGPPELPRVELVAVTPVTALVGALRRCVAREEQRPERYVPVPIVSLREMTQRLLTRLGSRRVIFSRLLGRSAGRSEHAVAFIALLTLLRQRVIDASQAAPFAEIEVERRLTTEYADD